MENPYPINDAFNAKYVLNELEKTLFSLGILPIYRGYQYIVEAEMMIFEDGIRIFLLVGEVYPNVAVRCYTTASRVERAIKHAIEISWSWNGEGSLKKQYSDNSFVPTNKQFLNFLYQRILQAN